MTETLLAMMTGDERAFAAMPSEARDYLNAQRPRRRRLAQSQGDFRAPLSV